MLCPNHKKDMSLHNRILYIDYAKSIALFLVVFAHLYSADSDVRKYIYAFHMPFFFIVSGMLHKDYDSKDLLLKMSKSLLIPFCFFLFIGYVFNAIWYGGLWGGGIVGSIKGIILGSKISANPVLWFLLALFFVRVVGNMMIKRPLLLIVGYVPLFMAFNLFKINYFFIGSALMALPFYVVGHYAYPLITNILKWHLRPMLAFLLLLLTIVISNYNGKVSMYAVIYGNSDSHLLNMLLFYLNGFIGSMMLLCLVGGGEKNNKDWDSPLKKRDKYSRYAIHSI